MQKAKELVIFLKTNPNSKELNNYLKDHQINIKELETQYETDVQIKVKNSKEEHEIHFKQTISVVRKLKEENQKVKKQKMQM